ncbi:MAG: glycosyltransferase [Deltaproteobacteria bacterium]|nr:glycosyltransferase [Deltaproteobacteria bacterium]
MGIAEETHIGGGETLSLLDVGSEDAYFQNMVPNIEYHSYDGFISSRNGAFLPYSDDSFDIVAAADVLEHVIPEDRQLFIYELIRVSKKRVIISFPNEMSAESEELILSFVPQYRWLREHQRNGLPKAEEIEKHMIDLGLSYKKKQNASLATWIYSVLFDQTNFNDQAKSKLNTFIQKNFYEFENNEPAYRSIYTIDIPSPAEKKGVLAKIDNYLCGIKQAEMPQVSIIIPVFNKVDFTQKCLETLYKNTPDEIRFEVIMVDNGSTDATPDYLEKALKRYPGLRVLSNSENLGFARSCNQGACAVSSEYLLFLNNDTEVQGGWIEPLMTVLDSDPNVVAVGSKMLFPDNTIQHAGVIILHDKRLPDPLGAMHVHSKQVADFDLANQLCTYQALTAACMLVRRSVFEAVGGYDEEYWNGFEDVDLCFKFQEKGGLLVYHPKSVVIHYESQSGPERFTSHDVNIKRLNQKWLGKVTQDLVIETNGKLTPNKTGHIRQYIIPGSSAKVETKESIVSIVIPVFNQLEFTKQCLESIKHNTPEVHYEVIIVDNGSSDGTTEYLQRIENDVKIIKNEKNLGFAKACNQGAFAAQSKYILFLNNDVKVNTGWLEPLISILDDDLDVAAVGSKLLFPDGTIQHAGVVIIDDRKLPDPLVGRHIHYRKEPDAPEANQRCVYQALTAACLLVRKSAFQEVGAFDEGYWNGYEDVDLCFKLQKNGGFLVYEPKSSAVHYESQSGPERFRQVSGNIRRLHQKWLGKIMPDIVIEADGKLRDSGAGKIAPYRIAKSINRQSGRLATTSEAFTSIIILVYNQLEYTKKCLESIFKYTKEPFELIVVDNGSTDGTVQYLEKLRNRYDSNGHEEKAGVATPKGRKKKGEKKKARTTDALNHVC